MKLESKIGLTGGVALVVGGVIGMGVYALIPVIATAAGWSTWLAVGIALVVSLLGVVPLIQLSSALPVAGGGYIYGSRLLHPLAGVLTSYWAIFGGASSVCVVAIGLADLLQPLLPFHVSLHLLAAALIAGFFLFYLFGLKLLTALQIIMTLQMLIALLSYAAAPLMVEGVEWHFAMPTAKDQFLMAIILSFNVCLGFQVITEMGEDIVNPKRNIPLALVIGAATILVIYLGISMSYIGLVGVENLATYGQGNAPLIESSRIFLPQWAVWFLALGAISAGLTSFNAGAIALPREIFAQARDLTLPAYFAKINVRTQSPLRAVTVFFGFVILILLFGQVLDSAGVFDKPPFLQVINFYGLLAACGIMMLTIIICLASVRLPAKYPDAYKAAPFRLSRPVLILLVVLSVISSGGFTLILFTESLLIPLIYGVFTILVLAYYFLRRQWLKKKGIDLGAVHDAFAHSEH